MRAETNISVRTAHVNEPNQRPNFFFDLRFRLRVNPWDDKPSNVDNYQMQRIKMRQENVFVGFLLPLRAGHHP